MTSLRWYDGPGGVDGVRTDLMVGGFANLCLRSTVVPPHWFPSHPAELVATASHRQLAFRPPDVTSDYVLRYMTMLVHDTVRRANRHAAIYSKQLGRIHMCTTAALDENKVVLSRPSWAKR